MKPLQFYNLVVEMRTHQKNYFRTHSMSSLSAARKIERIIDAEIDRVQDILKMERINKQLNLFETND